MKKAVRMAVAAGMCAALAFSVGCQNKTVADDEVQRYAWPLATASPEDTVTQIYAEKFAEEVEELSDGKMKIQVYPNGTIGGDRELLESCKDGDIPFVIQNTAPQVTFMPDLAVFDIPCRFSTIDEVREKVDDPEFYGLLEDVSLAMQTRDSVLCQRIKWSNHWLILKDRRSVPWRIPTIWISGKN